MTTPIGSALPLAAAAFEPDAFDPHKWDPSGGVHITADVIVDTDVRDQTVYYEYKALAPAAVAAYGGRFLARAGRTEKLEGDWPPTRLVILEFESMERADEWLESPEYRPGKKLRHAAAHSNMVAIEGE